LGHSCPSLVGDRLWILGFDPESGMDVLWCLDANSGEVRWKRSWAGELMADGHGGGTLTTPAVAGGRVYTSSRSGVLRCTDAVTGDALWSVDLVETYGVEATRYGFGGSPLVIGDLVIVNAGRTFAFEREAGDLAWYTDDIRAMYSTPTPDPREPDELFANFTKEGLFLIETDGDIVGSYPWRKHSVSVSAASPIFVEYDIFISSAYNHGCALLRPNAGEFKPVFENKRLRTHMSTAVYVNGGLFGFDEARLKCLDTTGAERWRKRGLGMGAISGAADRLLIMSEDGELFVCKATLDGFEELSLQRVFEHGPCWTMPVLSDSKIYCRNGAGTLVCLDHSEPGEPTK